MSYDIIFNNMKQSDLDLEIIKRPFIPIPKRKIKTIDISDADGSYYMENETYEDIEISIEFNFIENNLDFIRQKIRNITFWLNNINDNKLRLMNDFEYYYNVKNVEMSEYTYDEIYEIQKFTVSFTCEPWQYLYSNQERLLNKIEFNGLYLSKPSYRIIGDGKCDFTVNGTKITCNVNKELIIDTEHDKILEADKTFAIGKTNIKAMQDLYLQHGKNIISWSEGFKIFYIPNYRAI
ncbi:phage tail protein [Clostridium botulinum]|uniref:distal tail protein Dit n=1 Tax=Clostridium botulinum TaxID=1491 RepID=UPI00217ECB55|nr:distal tail protein Dit [Clostridium botulinum]MCS6103570.1 phage tail protein [Clostridium botulinum]MCS6109002.1 phage tail protein [Clostridium botulinum]